VCVCMRNWVSPMEKRNFLKWFLEHHQLKRIEARKVIEYIINHYHILENVSFTEKIILSQKTIVISSMNSDEPGFIFYFNQRKTDEVSKVIGELMMNPSEKVYIIIHFRGKMLNHRYLQLIENPVLENIKQYEQFQKYAKEVDDLIDGMLLDKEIALLIKQIDDSLDKKDEDLFKSLTARLKEQYAKKQSG
jgi:uncharacterized protein YpiB (UPF0302 family)